MIEIVRAGKQHIPQVIEVWREFLCFNADAEPLWNPGRNAASEFEAALDKQMAASEALVLVALEAEEVLGFAIAEIDSEPPIFSFEKWGTIADLGVKKEHRRRGVGKKLTDAALEWFKGKGVSLVQIYALTGNGLAVSFWPKQGFKPFSQRMYRLI